MRWVITVGGRTLMNPMTEEPRRFNSEKDAKAYAGLSRFTNALIHKEKTDGN